MSMPVLGPEHRRLDLLLGIWEGEERLHPTPWDPVGGLVESTVRNAPALEGFAVVQDFEQRREGRVTFRGHGVFRWDGAASDYALHWFDSMGQAPSEFHGNWEGNCLRMVSRGTLGSVRATWAFEGDAYAFTMEVSGDGAAWAPFIEGAYRRVG